MSSKMLRTLTNMQRLTKRSKSSIGLTANLASIFTSLHHERVENSSKKFLDDQFAQVVSNAEKIVGYPTSFMSLRCLLSDEMNTVAMYIRKLVGTNHPLLKIARGLVFNGRYGMQTRGLIVLLLAKAAGEGEERNLESEIVCGIHNKQRQLAEIIETIHLADLIHKGIVNLRDLELEPSNSEGQPMKDMEFGNKITVLTGDFLLANACTNLAKLENPKVVETVSDSISQMMEAHFVYLDNEPATPEQWEEFTFLSRGSLLANCCSCSLKLADAEDELQEAAFEYGKYLSYAHQIREDLRPFIEGAPTITDQMNRRSFPVIHYCNQSGTGNDVRENGKLLRSVRQSDSLRQSQSRCSDYGAKAVQALGRFQPSSSRTALEDIVTALTTFPNS